MPQGIAVATGNVDAHVTAPAAHAIAPGQMLAIMGTSTCHVMNGGSLSAVPGICGVVDGGIIDGFYGYEAGQSAVGDIFAWWIGQGLPASYSESAAALGLSAHEYLTSLTRGRAVGRARPASRWTGWAATGPSSSITTCRGLSSG